MLLYSDQKLMAPNLSAIAEDFGFSDQEKDQRLGGAIAVAFFGLGAPASLLVGGLSDFVDRRKLFVTIVLVGEVAALATVWVTTYSQLYWTRALTGIAIGGSSPLVYSILGDLVGNSKRTEAAGMMGIVIGFGQGMGQMIAGFTGQATSLGWRFPFLLVSVPCLALSAVFFITTRDPPRGRTEQALQDHFQRGGDYAELTLPTNLKGLRMLAGLPTSILVLTQGLPGCIPAGVIGVYLNDFLYKERGLTIKQATMVMMVLKLGTIIGQFAGAKIGQLAYNRRSMLQSILMGAATIGSVLPFVMLIQYDGGSISLFTLFAITGGILVCIAGPMVRSVLMNVTFPSTRGMAFGVFNLSDELGKGLGPALVSVMMATSGRETAFTVAVMAWLVSGIMQLSMACTVEKDEAKWVFKDTSTVVVDMLLGIMVSIKPTLAEKKAHRWVQAHLKEYVKCVATHDSKSTLSLPMSVRSVSNHYSVVPNDNELEGNTRVSKTLTEDNLLANNED